MTELPTLEDGDWLDQARNVRQAIVQLATPLELGGHLIGRRMCTTGGQRCVQKWDTATSFDIVKVQTHS